ncbi:type IV pilus modification protein PilV [Rhizobacter sp. Root404]|uniref:type IV pilus modification protein PilV n=1 Tax=Rhizobacter sp. Root404 TaxID=1736528 RepID=UPI003527B780
MHVTRMTRRRRSGAQPGFSLIEVMVTLVVVAIGVLGVSKLQAASVSNTQVSRVRSLLSLQAGSLAAAMHANPMYWASGKAPANFTVAGTTVSDPGGVLSAPPGSSCTGTAPACTPEQIAALDVQTWAGNLSTQLPTYSGTVTCSTTAPVTCQISLSWSEKYVATNTASAQATQTGTPTFTLFVSP